MIDEKKLIEDLIPILNKNGDMYLAGQIIACIDMQPKADWIPCEERLPSEEGNYCVTRENGEVDIDCFLVWANGGSFNNCYDDNPIRFPEKKVIAWQPLPQPYKKEGAE